MLHTIEELIDRLNVMKDKAIELHRLRNQYSELSGKKYDKAECQALLDDIQSMAKLIAEDKQGNEIRTSMDEWKKETVIVTEDDGYHD
jgi:hypothetical protein